MIVADTGGLAELVGGTGSALLFEPGNADQLAMFTGVPGWTPPAGWIVRGTRMSVCSVANVVCLVDNAEASLTEVMQALAEAARW